MVGAIRGFLLASCGTENKRSMPRATKPRPRPSRRDARTTGESSTWVRKNMRIDQKKLDEVKRLLRVSTETKALDAALEEVAFRHGLVEGMRALKRSGGLADFADER